MRSVDGPAQAGDYVAIIVMGATLVKVQDGETILAGQRLAAGVSTVGRYQKRLSGPLLDRSAKPPCEAPRTLAHRFRG